MATGGTSRIPQDSEGQKLDVKRFAYDVLCITLSKCGFPETNLKVQLDVDKKNNYRHPDYVINVHYDVLCCALETRDKWKRMFEFTKKNSALKDMQLVQKFCVNVEVLPEFRKSQESDKIKRSLAFFSELMLFLHHYSLEVDFEKLLDTWINYFNKAIAVNYDSHYLLEAIFVENDISIQLSLVEKFIEKVAKPYGKEDVSEKFLVFCDKMGRSFGAAKTYLERLTQECGDTHLESKLKNPTGPSSKAVKKSVSFSPIPETESALSGSFINFGGPRIKPVITFTMKYPRIEGTEAMPLISCKEKFPERKDQKSGESSEMAAEGTSTILKGSKLQKYDIKRFAYDILYITLSKCGFPKNLLNVYLGDKRNYYRYDEYVLTVYSSVIFNSLNMRDKWKRMFEVKQKSSTLNNMKKVEKFLLKIESLPDLSGESELHKIWRSLAFYSELILFLHHNNLEVEFEKFLDIWCKYFNEKVAVKYESDFLLNALCISPYCNVASYVSFLDGFLEENAIPYGNKADVSKRFQEFSAELENFNEESGSPEKNASPPKSTPSNLLDPLPEDVAESVSIPSAVVRKDSVSSDNYSASEQSHNLPDPPPEDFAESVSIPSAIVRKDSVSSDNRSTLEQSHNLPDPPPEDFTESVSIPSAIVRKDSVSSDNLSTLEQSHNLPDPPPESVAESVSIPSAIVRKDSVSSDNRGTLEQSHSLPDPPPENV